MKKAIITGVNGHIASYLSEILLDNNYDVHGIIRRTSTQNTENIDHIKDKLTIHYGDLSDYNSLEKIIREVKPDVVFNLAAQSAVGISYDIPLNTIDITGTGAIRIFEAVRQVDPTIKIVQASTSELYSGETQCCDESTKFEPKSPYAVAKHLAYQMSQVYNDSYNMNISNAITFNSESKRRGKYFVTRKITKGIADILNNKQDYIELGYLDSKRSWNHTADTAMAMYLISQENKPNMYIVNDADPTSVRDFVEKAFKEVDININWKGSGINEVGYDINTGKEYIKINPQYYRPNEVYYLNGDSSKIKKELGWSPQYSLNDIIKEMVENDCNL